MKLRSRLLFLFPVLLFSLAVFTKPLLLFALKGQLEKIFSGSKVSLGAVDLKFWQASLSHIEISKPPLYDLKIGQLQAGISGIVLRNVVIDIDLAQESISELPRKINLPPGRAALIPISLEVVNLSLNLQSREFDLSTKFNGSLKLKTKGGKIEAIDGNFSSLSPGGELAIKDPRYLEQMARSSGQSLDILLESFKDYRYNNGAAQLSLQGNDLVLSILLEGDVGKRDFKVTLHDFNLGRER